MSEANAFEAKDGSEVREKVKLIYETFLKPPGNKYIDQLDEGEKKFVV